MPQILFASFMNSLQGMTVVTLLRMQRLAFRSRRDSGINFGIQPCSVLKFITCANREIHKLIILPFKARFGNLLRWRAKFHEGHTRRGLHGKLGSVGTGDDLAGKEEKFGKLVHLLSLAQTFFSFLAVEVYLSSLKFDSPALYQCKERK